MRKEKKCKNRTIREGLCLWIKTFLIGGLMGTVLLGNTLCVQAEEYEYDVLNRVTKVTYEDGSYVEYEYDSNGNILSVNVYNAKPTPAPDTGQSSEETESVPEGETEESTSGETETEESESGTESSGTEDESTEQTKESESSTDDTAQESEVRQLIEQAIESITAIVKAISQWFQSWF